MRPPTSPPRPRPAARAATATVTAIMAALATLFIPGFAAPTAGAEPILPGMSSAGLTPQLKGLILMEELNCVACHAGSPSLVARSKPAPKLAGVGSRVNPAYLETYLANPHSVKPGTTMPDVLAGLGENERRSIATDLTQFLLSQGPNTFAPKAPDAVAARHGKRLFQARGCAACHSPRDDQGRETLPATSTPLGPLDRKYSFASLVEFLRQPHVSRPGRRMPDLRLSGSDLERIAHYLLQDTRVPGSLHYTLYRGDVWEGLDSEKVSAERAGHIADFALDHFGKLPHHSGLRYDGWIRIPARGRHTFHVEWNGGSLSVDGRPLLELAPSDRRGIKTLEATADLDAGWHRLQVAYVHTGRDPRFRLEMSGPNLERQPIPSAMLSVTNGIVPAFAPPKPDAAATARGRDHFARLGCAQCHSDLPAPPRPAQAPTLARLKPDSTRGCLSGTDGAWPRFELTPAQRQWVALALPIADQPQLTDAQQIDKTLATFNCVACHERAGLGGIPPERQEQFTGTQPAMGDQGRLPPPLSLVGAKLQSNALAAVLLEGKRPRPYVDASMPQFGEANVGHLPALFAKVDRLEAAPIPPVDRPAEFRAAGHELVGSDGLACIACHEFNGQKSGEINALDLATATSRLQKNWFHLYLRQPSRFHPTVIMPTYWPEGQSARTNLLDGDAARQIEAIWTYLADGPRARKPVGLSRQSSELRVGDTTEICRGRGPAGYRGIAVGYPERLNLAFDSGEMTLRLLWKGDFASADAGSFQPRGTDQIAFAPGIPFHRLTSPDENWPYKGKTNHPFPQDQGYQFRGYHLDAQRRPTFRYLYGDIAVEDYFEDVRPPATPGSAPGPAYFKRVLRFTVPGPSATAPTTPAPAPKPFHFRAATGKTITPASGRTFRIDRLQLRITSGPEASVRVGSPDELLIPLTLPAGGSTLTLEYQW